MIFFYQLVENTPNIQQGKMNVIPKDDRQNQWYALCWKAPASNPSIICLLIGAIISWNDRIALHSPHPNPWNPLPYMYIYGIINWANHSSAVLGSSKVQVYLHN